MRSTFINTLVTLAEADERIFLITPDMGFSVLEAFQQRFPDRFLNVGIAEANAVGVAAGLALSGRIVYVYSIIPFVCMRPFEQVRVDAAYMNTNIRLVGVGAGLSYGPAGGTHHAVEDLALMRALPNMSVVAPCDPWEVQQALRHSITHSGPIYLRLARNGEPVLSDTTKSLAFGAMNTLRPRDDAVILLLTTSNAVDVALGVYDALSQANLPCELTSVPFIKPFDAEGLQERIAGMSHVIVIEEHCRHGGLGSCVADVLARSAHNPVFLAYDLGDSYSHFVGNQGYIRERFGFTPRAILKDLLPRLTR